jgi:hypothetical protein
MMTITSNSVSMTGDMARQFARLSLAMRQMGRGLMMQPGGSYISADGSPLPSEEQIITALAAAERTRLRTSLPAITARQLRLWLNGAGLLEQIPALIAALPEPQRTTAQIEWEFSSDYQRDHPLVTQLGAALGMTSADMDLAWKQAAGL